MSSNDKQSNITDLHLSDVIEFINELEERTSPYIKIVEQPASKALRFRYECESRSAGSIPGVNSRTENKTYPTIQIVGYKGRAVVVVSCVTKDRPYRPHPHKLVGRDCKHGICSIEVNDESMRASFQNLGIQCVRRRDIDNSLKLRETKQVDPFGTGFSHKENLTSIDLNAVRLCFQAFLGEKKQKEKYSILEPVVSDPIYDKKAMSDLSICRLSDATASVVGGKEIILLCEKVTKDDIQVRFFEEKDGECIWEDYGVFKPQDVHKQVAIWFKTPKYKITEIDSPVNVRIQLKRFSDGMCSVALPFEFTPHSDGMKRKIQKLFSESELLSQLQNDTFELIDQSSNFIDIMIDESPISVPTIEEPGFDYNIVEGLHKSISSYDQTTFPKTNIPLPNTAEIQTSKCNFTKVCPTVNSNNPTPQKNYPLPTSLPEDIYEPNYMEPARLDSRLVFSDLGTWSGDSRHVSSINLPADLHLTDRNFFVKSPNKK